MSDTSYNWGPPFPKVLRSPWETIASTQAGSVQSQFRGNYSRFTHECERSMERILKCLDGEIAILRWECDDPDCLSSLLYMGSRGEITSDQYFKVKLLAIMCELGIVCSDEHVQQEALSMAVPSSFDPASVTAIRQYWLSDE